MLINVLSVQVTSFVIMALAQKYVVLVASWLATYHSVKHITYHGTQGPVLLQRSDAVAILLQPMTAQLSKKTALPWWRHQMETFSALLAICAGNSPVTGEFPVQRPVTRSFGVFFDLRPNKRLSKQSWCWWFETPSRPLWRHSTVNWAAVTWQ